MVCPSKLRRELFTTAAVDNIDHNTSSTSSQSSFHGTAISLVQHPSDTENGTTRVVDTFDPKNCSSKTITELPACYRDIAPMAFPNKELKAPALSQQSLESSDSTCNDKGDEKDWLSRAQELCNKEELDPKDCVVGSLQSLQNSTLHL